MSPRFGRALCLFGEGHAALGLATIAAAIEPWPPAAAFATAAPDAGAAAAAAALAALEAGAASARDREPRRLADRAWQQVGGAVGAPDRALLLASALGGLHHLDFGPAPFVTPLAARLGPVVCVEPPGEGCAARRRQAHDLTRAIVAELVVAEPCLDLARLAFDDAWNLLSACPARATDAATRERLLFSLLQSRDLLLAAHALLAAERPTGAILPAVGELLDRDHAQRDAALRQATPRTTRLRHDLLAAGAMAVWSAGERLVALVGGDDAEPAVAALLAAAAAHGAPAAAFSVAAARSA